MIPESDKARFWSKVDVRRPGECWGWQAAPDHYGYGQFWLDGTMQKAHRVAFAIIHGSIDENLQLDHTCKNRSCVNPSHLEQVTHAENQRRARKSHCRRGHPFDLENVLVTSAGRNCKTCRRAYERKQYQERRTAASRRVQGHGAKSHTWKVSG